MRIYSLVLAWMLVGSTFLSQQCAAENAAELPSVMVRGSGGAAPAAQEQLPASPASGAGDAPARAPPAGSAPAAPPAGSAPAVPVPNSFPDVGEAKPLAPQGDAAVTPPVDPFPATTPSVAPPATTSDGKLILPSPPETEPQPAGVKPAAGYEELLPPPRGANTGVPNQFSPSNPIRSPGTTSSVVAPPASSSPPVDPAAQAAARAAADLLKNSLSEKPGDGLVPLREYLERCGESQRAAVAQAYWRLIRSASNYGWARDEQKRLEQIVPSRSSVEGPMLSAVRGAAAARVTEAELEISNAWGAVELAAATGGHALSDKRGVLHDTPLVGPYHTYYNQIFANRPNRRAYQIDQALPLRTKAINDWVATVHSATSAVYYAEQAHAKGEADLRTVLACHDDLRTQRRKFLDAVMQYNIEIADYAALAAPAGTSAEKFASMLIPAKPAERVSSVPGRPALPLGAGGQRQPPAGHDGWMPSQGRPQMQQLPQAPVAGSGGATGDWQNPGTGNAAPPPAQHGWGQGAACDPFTPGVGNQYGTPSR